MALPLCGSLFADCVCVCETAEKGSKDLTALRMATNCEASTTCTALSYLNGRNMHNICRFPSAPPSRSLSLSLCVTPLRQLQVCVHIKRKRKTESGKTKIIIRKRKKHRPFMDIAYALWSRQLHQIEQLSAVHFLPPFPPPHSSLSLSFLYYHHHSVASFNAVKP